MKKKIIAIALVLMLVVGSLPMMALAATEGKVKTVNAGGTLNLRSGPSTSNEILGYVQDGDAITVNFQGSEWSNITVSKSGKSGYIKNKYIVLSGSSSGSGSTEGGFTWGSGSTSSGWGSSSSGVTAGSTAYVYVSAKGGSLNVRAGESTSTAINGWVQHGDAVTVVSVGSGEWSKITNKSGKTGYIKTKYLRTSGSGSSGSGSSTPSTSGSYDLATVMTKTVGGRVNVRTGATTSSSSVTTTGRGTILKVSGTSGDWAKVTLLNGKSGYMHKNYVSYGIKGTTTANSLNLRKGPGTSYGVQSVLSKGATIVIHSISGNWAKVTVGSKTGYVHTNYIKY